MGKKVTAPVTADVLSKQIKALQSQLFNAKVHYDLYMSLSEAWRGKHNREMRDSPFFWQFTMGAHINGAVLHLCRAYDSNKKALQLSRFLENVAQSASVFCESEFRERHKANPHVDWLAQYPRTISLKCLQDDLDFCNSGNPLVKNLRRWRNELVAHFNYEEAVVAKEPMHKRCPLPWADVKRLIDEGLAILNRYSELLDAKTYSNQLLSHQEADYTYVLKSLRFARIARAWNQRRFHMTIRRKLAESK
jgi:hypothetical protein